MSQSQNNDVVLHSDASDLFNKFRVPVNLVKEFKEHGYKPENKTSTVSDILGWIDIAFNVYLDAKLDITKDKWYAKIVSNHKKMEGVDFGYNKVPLPLNESIFEAFKQIKTIDAIINYDDYYFPEI